MQFKFEIKLPCSSCLVYMILCLLNSGHVIFGMLVVIIVLLHQEFAAVRFSVYQDDVKATVISSGSFTHLQANFATRRICTDHVPYLQNTFKQWLYAWRVCLLLLSPSKLLLVILHTKCYILSSVSCRLEICLSYVTSTCDILL